MPSCQKETQFEAGGRGIWTQGTSVKSKTSGSRNSSIVARCSKVPYMVEEDLPNIELNVQNQVIGTMYMALLKNLL